MRSVGGGGKKVVPHWYSVNMNSHGGYYYNNLSFNFHCAVPCHELSDTARGELYLQHTVPVDTCFHIGNSKNTSQHILNIYSAAPEPRDSRGGGDFAHARFAARYRLHWLKPTGPSLLRTLSTLVSAGSVESVH